MEQLKDSFPYILTLLAILGYLGTRSWNDYQKRKDERAVLDKTLVDFREKSDKEFTLLREYCEKNEESLNDTKVRIASIEATNSYWLRSIEQYLAKTLKSPDHEEKDKLLSHLEKGDLTLEEAETLRNIFDHEKDKLENKEHLDRYLWGIMALDMRIRILRAEKEKTANGISA